MQSFLIYAFLLFLVPALIQGGSIVGSYKASIASCASDSIQVSYRAQNRSEKHQLLGHKHFVKAVNVERFARLPGSTSASHSTSLLTIGSTLLSTRLATAIFEANSPCIAYKQSPLWLIYCTFRL
ncbi:MAG: hypothetical protein K8F91_26910 [Candidatus Obscuribacterales bacterium]|nr:hypothetical protein [Candidatus Obscuribacterales bacterium]